MGQEVGGLHVLRNRGPSFPLLIPTFPKLNCLRLRVLGHGPSRYTTTNGNYLLVSYTLSMWRESCEGLYCQESRSNTRLYPLYSSYPETSPNLSNSPPWFLLKVIWMCVAHTQAFQLLSVPGVHPVAMSRFSRVLRNSSSTYNLDVHAKPPKPLTKSPKAKWPLATRINCPGTTRIAMIFKKHWRGAKLLGHFRAT